jgi:predicted nucleotidyltransferase
MDLERDEALPRVVVEECENVASTLLSNEPRVTIFLFGSRAAGRGIPRSDIDIGIDVGHPIAPEVMVELRERFDVLPVLQRVDLVDFSRVDPTFRRVALEEVIVLHERNAA